MFQMNTYKFTIDIILYKISSLNRSKNLICFKEFQEIETNNNLTSIALYFWFKLNSDAESSVRMQKKTQTVFED